MVLTLIEFSRTTYQFQSFDVVNNLSLVSLLAPSMTLKDLNHFKCLRVWCACAPVTQVVAISEQMPDPPGRNQRFKRSVASSSNSPKGPIRGWQPIRPLAAAPQNATVEWRVAGGRGKCTGPPGKWKAYQTRPQSGIKKIISRFHVIHFILVKVWIRLIPFLFQF